MTEKAFQEKFCQLLQQLTPVHWLTAVRPITDDTTSPGEGIFSEAAVTGKIQEVGGKLRGSSVGWVMGFSVGAVAGGLLLGPLGLIPGAGVGSAVGRTVGSQLGGETARYLSSTGAAAQPWPVSAKNPAESVQTTLELGATELIGETFGGMAGFVVGGSLQRPARFSFWRNHRRCYRRTSRRGMVVLAADRLGKNRLSGSGAVNLKEFWAISQ